MARDQALDADFRRVSADARTGLQLRAVQLDRRKLIVDISNGPARPFVPYSWRKRVFELMHGLGHPGVERTRQTITEKFVWPSIRQDVTKWARECQHCQRAKILRHTTPPIGEFIVPEKRFDHLNLDLVTLTPSNGYKYLLTIVDRFSRWPIAIPIKDIAVDTILDAFAHGWVATYGVPSSITTDRGSQFLSAAWNQLMATWGISTHTTTAYHPEANGLVERLHRRLKEALLAASHDCPQDWYWKLPAVLLSIRTTLKPDLGASPAEMLYGAALSVPGSLLSNPPSSDEQLHQQQQQTLNNLRLEVARLQPIPTSAHRRQNVRMPEELQDCTHVFIRKGGVQPCFSSPYSGPYRVLSRHDHYFRVSIPGRGAESVAMARLKPAVVASDREFQQNPSPVTPPPRRGPGRPPGRRQGDPPAPLPAPTTPVRGRGGPRRRPPSVPPQPPSTPPPSVPPSPPPVPHSPLPAPPSPHPAPPFSPPPAHPPPARRCRSPPPPRCFLEDSPPRPPTPPPPGRPRGRLRRDSTAGTNSIALPPASPHCRAPLPPPLPPVASDEPNRSAHLQQQQETELVPALTSVHTRPRPVTAARAAAASRQHDVIQNEFENAPEPVLPRAAAAAAPPRRFTRPHERNFSADRRQRGRPNVSYAASLSAILQQHIGTVP